MHEQSVSCGAGLAHVAHLGGHGAVDRAVQVRVLEDDERRVATQFHGGAHDVLRGLFQEADTHIRGSGEADLASNSAGHPRADHRGSLLRAHHVEHPGGSPASIRMSTRAREDSGVRFAGLNTMVQPAAMAGPILRVPMASGKFHGVTSTHGPTGCLDTMMRFLPSAVMVWSPPIRTASSENQRKNSAA